MAKSIQFEARIGNEDVLVTASNFFSDESVGIPFGPDEWFAENGVGDVAIPGEMENDIIECAIEIYYTTQNLERYGYLLCEYPGECSECGLETRQGWLYWQNTDVQNPREGDCFCWKCASAREQAQEDFYKTFDEKQCPYGNAPVDDD